MPERIVMSTAKTQWTPHRARGGQASPVPLIVAVVAVTVSATVAVVVGIAMSAPVIVFGVTLPLVRTEAWGASLLGYVLTPIFAVVCVGWDDIWQRRGRQRDVNFVMRGGYATASRWLAGAAVGIGLWHILNLSIPLSELWMSA